MASCPECDAAIEIDDTMEEGETLDCPECGVTLEVVNTNPVELDVVTDESEDEDIESW
jgi:alpha-aminoadipate carrier protein LysW